jgi:serine protease Do
MGKRLLPQLKSGRVRYGFLGVYIQDLTPELAQSFGLKEPRGVLISEVVPSGAAEKAGLKKGDVVLQFNGEEIKNAFEFRKMVGNTPVGKTVDVVVLREGKRMTVPVTPEELSEEEVAVAPTPEEEVNKWGIKVQDVSPELVNRLGIPENAEGVLITEVEPGTPAENAGLRQGDVIVEVERHAVKNMRDYREQLKRAAGKNALLLTVRVRAHQYHLMYVVLNKS